MYHHLHIHNHHHYLLIDRVRDEARMTITAFETLYESSIAYGVRKALGA